MEVKQKANRAAPGPSGRYFYRRNPPATASVGPPSQSAAAPGWPQGVSLTSRVLQPTQPLWRVHSGSRLGRPGLRLGIHRSKNTRHHFIHPAATQIVAVTYRACRLTVTGTVSR